ncbi:trafficking protein particle complex subunit 9 [Elysia marginata]|uniref:Trafficking protein particle complex subunit 9 n=1 Tax=Elysia marginata TaxID=1093978 RepID=A0AAV4I4G1_9GAST|nr:trafficking protein particle complex subunit 9 [Elysia marginata]
MAAQVIDYSQTAEDHRSLLVLVRHTGPHLHAECFNRIYERISCIKSVRVQGQNREICVRFRRSYSVEANSWGEFQSHRKVLGSITVGKCSDHAQFAELFASYSRHKEEYAASVINSRLVAFGLNSDGSALQKDEVEPPENASVHAADDQEQAKRPCDSGSSESVLAVPVDSEKQQSDSKFQQTLSGTRLSPVPSSLSLSPSPSLHSSLPSSTSPSPQAESKEQPSSPAANSRRHSFNSQDNNNKSKPAANGVATTPSGSKSPNTSRTSASPYVSRSNPDKTQSRQAANLPKESGASEIVFYPSLDACSDIEERIRDFITSLYFVLEGKRLDRSFERNEKSMPLCAPFEKKDFVGVDTEAKSFKKKCQGRLRKHLGDLCLQAATPGDAVLHYNTALDILRQVNDFLWMAGCVEGLCCASIILSAPRRPPSAGLKRNLSFQTVRGLPAADSRIRTGSTYTNGLDVVPDPVSQPILNIEDVVEKYKEAIQYYAKVKAAAMIELEASLKACRFLITHRKCLQASDFLQNAVYISFLAQEEDKVQRNITLSSLYNQIGFKRKAAFFRRVAGMHCVSPDTTPSWSQCYELLLQCLGGYGLNVDPKDVRRDRASGWPVLQYRVLHELIYSARRISNPHIAVRHMSLLVDLMLPHLSTSDQRETLSGLSSLTAKCMGSPQPIVLGSGLVLPPVPLLSLPIVRSFRLLAPSPHLEPTKLPDQTGTGGGTSGVFLYKPSSLATKRTDLSKPDFKWTCGDVCEASLQLTNPLADELKVFYMGLMTSDLETEILPANPNIPADLEPMNIKLKVKPKAAGTLKILGYTTVVFGVKSNCRLRDLRELRPSPLTEIQVEVIPPLPTLTLSCSLPKATTFSTLGSTGVNNDIVASGSAALFAVHEAISWSQENIQAQLPLEPGHQLCFSLQLRGNSDFLVPAPETPARTPMSHSSRSRSDTDDGNKEKSLEAVLTLQYSGGGGLAAGYCRQCSLALNLDTLPSVYVSNWTVQHTYSAGHCRLCLDLTNHCGHQMDIHYGGQDKTTSLGPLQTRSRQLRLKVELE